MCFPQKKQGLALSPRPNSKPACPPGGFIPLSKSLTLAASGTCNTLSYSHLLPPTTPTWLISIHVSRLCRRSASLRNGSKATEHSKRCRCEHHRLSQQTTWVQILALLLTVPLPCCVTLGKFKLGYNCLITLSKFKVFNRLIQYIYILQYD